MTLARNIDAAIDLALAALAPRRDYGPVEEGCAICGPYAGSHLPGRRNLFCGCACHERYTAPEPERAA